MARVALGISGGIDSAISAHLLKQQGFEVIGVHLQMYNQSIAQKQAIEHLCAQLGIPLFFVDLINQFENEIIHGYLMVKLKGRTLSPCYHCNTNIKWQALFDFAKANNCQKIATGHYINFIQQEGTVKIVKHKDEKKDQSYYLWGLANEILEMALAPLSSFTKKDIIGLADSLGYKSLTEQKESAGLCFAQKQTNKLYVQQLLNDKNITVNPGHVYNDIGKPIGKHQGIVFYTIGQKKGLNLNASEKLCVKTIDADKNTIIVTHWKNLYTKTFTLSDFSIHDNVIWHTNLIEVKVRGFGLNPKPGATVSYANNDKSKLQVQLQDDAWAVCPGQPVVFYYKETVIGGGIVDG